MADAASMKFLQIRNSALIKPYDGEVMALPSDLETNLACVIDMLEFAKALPWNR